MESHIKTSTVPKETTTNFSVYSRNCRITADGAGTTQEGFQEDKMFHFLSYYSLLLHPLKIGWLRSLQKKTMVAVVEKHAAAF